MQHCLHEKFRLALAESVNEIMNDTFDSCQMSSIIIPVCLYQLLVGQAKWRSLRGPSLKICPTVPFFL